MQGLILLNKPKGITSFSAVSKVKRIASEKRVGHTGTLDPMATGVLPILLGRATTLSSLMLDADKKYIARVKLGITTDSDDITGEVLQENEVSVDNARLNEVLDSFLGKQSQIPPMYSAIKKDGVRLYKLAREGKTAEIEPRNIEIYSINLLEPLDDENTFKIEVHVSKGTYIRSLARDIGEALGCGATLTELERTYASGFSLDECVSIAELEEKGAETFLYNEEKAVEHFPQITVTQKQAIRFCNGGQLGFDRLRSFMAEEGCLYRVKFGDKLLGIGFADVENKQIGIKCILNYPEG